MLAVLPNPGLAIAELGNPGSRRKSRKKNTMATKRKRRRLTPRQQIKRDMGIAKRHGDTASYRSLLAAYAGSARRKRMKGKTYPRKVIRRGRNKGTYPSIRVLGSSAIHRRRTPVRHPSVSWSGRKGTRTYAYQVRGTKRKGYFTNPRRRRRRNPGLASYPGRYAKGFMGSVQMIPKIFSGKNAMKNTAYAAGGAVAAYVGGGYVSKMLSPVLSRIPGMGGDMAKRIVGGMMPWTAAFVASQFIKDRQIKAAIQVGGAFGSVMELLMPGMIGSYIARIPGMSAIAAQESAESGTSGLYGPVSGLYGYVTTPAYQGVGEYVKAPGYQGVGAYMEAPAYQGVGYDPGEDALAGMTGPVAQSSFLDESFLA